MKKFVLSRSRTYASVLAGGLGALLWTCALRSSAFALGVINTYFYETDPGKLDVGLSAMGRQEIFHYCDVGARIGVMHSDALDTDYFPFEVTAAAKYPFCDGHFVPFIGGFAGIKFFSEKYHNGESLGLNGGFDWRLGEEKKWSIFVEANYDFKDHVHFRTTNGEVQTGGGPGAALGITYRF